MKERVWLSSKGYVIICVRSSTDYNEVRILFEEM